MTTEEQEQLFKEVCAVVHPIADFHPGIWQSRVELIDAGVRVFLDMEPEYKATTPNGWTLGTRIGLLLTTKFGKVSYGGENYNDLTFVMTLHWKQPIRSA